MGVNWACHACTLPGLLSLWLGNRASPWGPKFGISIQYGNGPPFAACHHKIGGFVLARVPPAEWGPVFLLCSMTPLTLSVDFLSLFLGRALSPLLISSAFLSSSRTALRKKKESADYRSHIPSEKVHLVIFLPLSRQFFWKWMKAESCRAVDKVRSPHPLLPRSNLSWSDECSYFPVSCGRIRVHDRTDAGVYAG